MDTSKILVTIECDSQFISFRTYDPLDRKRSARFLINKDDIRRYLKSDMAKFYDRDLNNLVSVTKSYDNMLRFEVFYIDVSYTNNLTGKLCEFWISEDDIFTNGKYVCIKQHVVKTKLHFSDMAQHLIATFDKQEKRALSKALRDHFRGYGTVEFYVDFGISFWFSEQHGISGGLVMHSHESHGDIAYTFSVHT